MRFTIDSNWADMSLADWVAEIPTASSNAAAVGPIRLPGGGCRRRPAEDRGGGYPRVGISEPCKDSPTLAPTS